MSGKLILFTTRITLLCVLFQFIELDSKNALAGPEDGPHPPAQSPPQMTVPAVQPDNQFKPTYSDVPNRLSTPTTLRRPHVKDSFHCERRFLYQGQTFGCDSYVQRDAERLRVVVADVPNSLREIDIYQENRKNVRSASYTFSAGLLIFFAGTLISHSFTWPTGGLSDTGENIRRWSTIGGLGLTLGSGIYGFTILTTNENHINRAVDFHNQAHPNNPIQLQFSTGFSL